MKSVSGILLLLLKHFKINHIYQEPTNKYNRKKYTILYIVTYYIKWVTTSWTYSKYKIYAMFFMKRFFHEISCFWRMKCVRNLFFMKCSVVHEWLTIAVLMWNIKYLLIKCISNYRIFFFNLNFRCKFQILKFWMAHKCIHSFMSLKEFFTRTKCPVLQLS